MADPNRRIKPVIPAGQGNGTRQEPSIGPEEFSLNTTSLLLPEEQHGVQKVVSIKFADTGLVLMLD